MRRFSGTGAGSWTWAGGWSRSRFGSWFRSRSRFGSLWGGDRSGRIRNVGKRRFGFVFAILIPVVVIFIIIFTIIFVRKRGGLGRRGRGGIDRLNGGWGASYWGGRRSRSGRSWTGSRATVSLTVVLKSFTLLQRVATIIEKLGVMFTRTTNSTVTGAVPAISL